MTKWYVEMLVDVERTEKIVYTAMAYYEQNVCTTESEQRECAEELAHVEKTLNGIKDLMKLLRDDG